MSSGKGTIVLRGGKGNYGHKTLIKNWEEDREITPVLRTTQAAGFETTKGVAEHESTCKSKVHYGADIQSNGFKPSSTMSYQGKEITGEWMSISRMSQKRDDDSFQKMFGSRFPLKPSRTLESKEMEAYHQANTIDRAARKERFVTEKVSFQNRAVGREFQINQMRRLPNVPTAIQSLQEELFFEHGVHAMHMNLKVFRVYDVNGNYLLERHELAALLEDLGICLRDDEMTAVWIFFDRDNSGAVDYNEFVAGLCGDFAPEREQAVRLAFRNISDSTDGLLSRDQLFDRMKLEDLGDASKESQVAREFYKQWPKPEQDWSDNSPLITEEDFVTYFKLLSPVFPDNDRFFRLVDCMWN